MLCHGFLSPINNATGIPVLYKTSRFTRLHNPPCVSTDFFLVLPPPFLCKLIFHIDTVITEAKHIAIDIVTVNQFCCLKLSQFIFGFTNPKRCYLTIGGYKAADFNRFICFVVLHCCCYCWSKSLLTTVTVIQSYDQLN